MHNSAAIRILNHVASNLGLIGRYFPRIATAARQTKHEVVEDESVQRFQSTAWTWRLHLFIDRAGTTSAMRRFWVELPALLINLVACA
jgi:hypothetical protein